jgi:hypothetical protein
VSALGDSQGYEGDRVRGRLVGVLRSPVRGGVTCLIEDEATNVPVMCVTHVHQEAELGTLVGRRVEFEGRIHFGAEGQVLRVDDAFLVSPLFGLA